MIKLTPHEQKILDLVKEYPEVINDPEKRKKIAEQNDLSEKTLRNRIGDLKKYGVLPSAERADLPIIDTDFDDIDLFRIGQIIWSAKIEIIRNVIIVSILSVILAFMLPKTYRATALIMPPSSSGERNMFGSGAGLFALESLLNPVTGTDANTFIAILKSRTVMQSVIEKFDLVDFYNVDVNEKAKNALENDTNFEIDDEGTIRVTTYIKTGWFHYKEDEDTCMALSRDITNYFLTKLDEVNKKLKSEKATQHRGFIENRYYQNIEDLAKAEDRLNMFQKKYHLVSLEEQTTAAIQVATEIISRLSISKVKLSILEETYSKDHPEIKLLKSEIAGLNTQLKELNYGEKEITMIPGFSEVPDLGLALGRLIRDVEVQNTLYTFLTQQYEEAKIQEAKNTPTVQVLDYALLPQLKYKPVRSRILIIGFVLSSIFSMYYVYFRTRWQIFSRTIK
jgi:capsule polysaccharide export protein KpsE/RkpR